MGKARLTYEIIDNDGFNTRECSTIKLDIPDDLDIYEMARVLKIFLYAVGYAETSIEEILQNDSSGSSNSDLFNDMFPPRIKE